MRASDGEQPNDRAWDVLDCGAGVDTVYFIPGQDVVRANCEIRIAEPKQPATRKR